jgi:hypothetical protein
MATTPTPRTEVFRKELYVPHSEAETCKLLIECVNSHDQLERELVEANDKINTIATDPNYEGGVQFWIRKHDKIASSLCDMIKLNQQLTTDNARLKTASEQFMSEVLTTGRVRQATIDQLQQALATSTAETR